MDYRLNAATSGSPPTPSYQAPTLRVTTDAHPIKEIASNRLSTTEPSAPPLKVTLHSVFDRITLAIGKLRSSKSITDIKKAAKQEKLDLVKVKPETIKAGDIVLVQRDQGSYCEIFEAVSKGTTVEFAHARANSALIQKTDHTVKLRGGIASENGLTNTVVEPIDTKTGTEYWLVKNKKVTTPKLLSFHHLTSIFRTIFRF